MLMSRSAFLLLITLSGSLLSAVLHHTWSKDLRRPAVTLIGTGSNLSVFVTSEDARFLLVVGDDPRAFADALSAVNRPSLGRFDVVIVAGRDRQLLAPVWFADDPRIRWLGSIGELPPGAIQRELPKTITPLSGPIRIALAPETEVRLWSRREPLTRDPTQWRVVWRMDVTHRDQVITIVSDAAAVDAFPIDRRVSVLVVSHGELSERILTTLPPALVVNDRAVDGRAVRRNVAPFTEEGRWVVRVHSGQAVRFAFDPQGVLIDPEVAQWITPRASLTETGD